MVYHYAVRWVWYDNEEVYVLTHVKKFSKEEWRKIFKEALRKAIKKVLRRRHLIGVDEIVKETVKILVDEYGFNRVNYVVDEYIWGACVLEEDDLRDRGTKKFIRLAGKRLVKKIIKHNIERKREMRL